MTVLTAAQVAQYAYQAGFRGDALITAVAISHAETDGATTGTFSTDARGDVGLETPKWGASIGLWQIRSLRADMNTGRDRDEAANLDPAKNARHAYSISAGGTNWRPWSTYTSGAYKAFLAEARVAAGAALGADQAPTTGGTPVVLNNPSSPVGPALDITIGGRLVTGSLLEQLVGGDLDLSTNGVSELTLEFRNPDFRLRREYALNIDSTIRYDGRDYRVVQLVEKQGPRHPHIQLKAHPEGVVRLRSSSPPPGTNVSPTVYLQQLAAAAGLRFVGEPTGSRPSIGPTTIVDATTRQKRPEFAWEIGQRLADDLGLLFFESGGTVFFGRAAFLDLTSQPIQLSYLDHAYAASAGPQYDLIEFPTCTGLGRTYHPAGETGTVEAGIPITYRSTIDYLTSLSIRGKVRRDQGMTLRPGSHSAILASGGSQFDGNRQLITRVRWSLDDLHSPVQVEAGTPTDRQGSARTPADDTAGQQAAGAALDRTHGASALDFVSLCLKQVGDTYTWGGTDPERGFDCSGLVYWATAQLGVKVPRTASTIFARIQADGLTCTVETAAKTRGAVLFRAAGTLRNSPTAHIAISLGDGRYTVEANSSRWGVVAHDGHSLISGRVWSGAGLLPGLAYR